MWTACNVWPVFRSNDVSNCGGGEKDENQVPELHSTRKNRIYIIYVQPGLRDLCPIGTEIRRFPTTRQSIARETIR